MDASLSQVCEEMAKTPSWAKGLLLGADGLSVCFIKRLN